MDNDAAREIAFLCVRFIPRKGAEEEAQRVLVDLHRLLPGHPWGLHIDKAMKSAFAIQTALKRADGTHWMDMAYPPAQPQAPADRIPNHVSVARDLADELVREGRLVEVDGAPGVFALPDGTGDAGLDERMLRYIARQASHADPDPRA